MKNTVELLQFRGSNKLPLILQTEVAECGLACIAMVANFFGHQVDLNSLRRKYSISSTGATLQGLINLADALKLSARPVRLQLEDIPKLKRPCILHWDLSHFVVLKEVKDNKIIIHDPAIGVKTISFEEASKHFTGVALELTPTPDFKPEKTVRRARLRDFWTRISGLKRVMIQIFILSILLQLFAIATPLYTQIVVDDVVISQDFDLLLILAIGFGCLALINIAVTALRSLVILYMSTQLNMQMAANLFRHLIRLPMDYFEKRHIGDVTSRFGSIQTVKEMLTTGVIESIVDGIMAIGLLLMMFIYSPLLGSLVLLSVFLYVLLRLIMYRPYHQLNEETIVANAKQNSNFMESIRAIQTIKLFGNEPQRQTVWQNQYADELNAGIKVGKLTIGYQAINGLIFGVENVLVIYLAATQVIDNLMTVGMLYAFMSYKQQFTGKASALVEKLIQFKMLSLHMERLGDIILSKQEKNLEQTKQLKIEQPEITVNDLSFRYSDNDPMILNQVNLSVKPGATVAIVGPSGCGKTTLMKTMLGLLEPVSGNVCVDGNNICDLGLKKYRSMIGSVMQSDQLLSGTIADNICFFEPEHDQKLIESCAEKAAILNDINRMPMGFQTLIGDMGSSLSGGQKQRILLARALYKNPKILFLDEATSHLDSASEALVNHTLKELNITRVIIAHRKETIAMADHVYLLNFGQLVDITNHE